MGHILPFLTLPKSQGSCYDGLSPFRAASAWRPTESSAMKFTKKTIVVVGIFAFLMLAVSIFLLRNDSFSKNYQKPKTGNIVESIYGLGTITSSQIFNLRTSVPVVVEQLFVEEGKLVKTGDLLGRFDQVTRKSPIDGTVTAVYSKLSELVNPQSIIMTVMNLKNLFIEVSLEQQSILRVQKGQKVLVSFENLRTEKYEGSVDSVYPRDNQFIVRILLDSWPKSILPGMTADVAILVGEKTNALLIPLKSIVAGEITRVRDGRKARIKIKLGLIDGDWGELIEGDILAEDELLVRGR